MAVETVGSPPGFSSCGIRSDKSSHTAMHGALGLGDAGNIPLYSCIQPPPPGLGQDIELSTGLN